MEVSSEVTNTIPQLLVQSNSKFKKLLKLPIWSTTGLSKKKKVLKLSRNFNDEFITSLHVF